MDVKLIRDFTETIKKQARLYGEIKGIVESKESAIKAGDAKRIETATLKEENLISAISAAELEMKAIFKKLAEAAGYGKNVKASIGDVLSKSDRGITAEVEKALAALSKAVSSAAGPNARNAYLLKNRLEFAGFSEAAREKIEQTESTTYGRDGGKRTEKSSSTLKVDRTI